MNASTLHLQALRVQLTLIRFGWLNGFVGLLCAVSIVAWLSGIPHLRMEAKTQQQAITLARQALRQADVPAPPVTRSVAEERLANFYDLLGEERYAEQQVKTLFALAGKAQLTLSQADYKPAIDKNGRYQTYQIILPVKGSYAAVRQFCEQLLLTIPFASLDEISFKRDAIGSRTLEAKLRITLYLADAAALRQSGKSRPLAQDDL